MPMKTEIPDTVEVTTNLIVNAIARKLREHYAYPVYAQALRQGFKAPCFFIEITRTTGKRLTHRRSERRLTAAVHYFPENFDKLDNEPIYLEEEPTEQDIIAMFGRDVEQHIFDVADGLYTLLEQIQVSGKIFNNNAIHIHSTDMSHNINGGVLHFIFNVIYQQLDEIFDPYMEVLKHTGSPKSHKRGYNNKWKN